VTKLKQELEQKQEVAKEAADARDKGGRQAKRHMEWANPGICASTCVRWPCA